VRFAEALEHSRTFWTGLEVRGTTASPLHYPRAMDTVQLLEALLQLAVDAGLEVRLVGPSASGEGELKVLGGSAVCKVRGEIWVVLATNDPISEQIALLSDTLKSHAGDYIEGHYLPPALRECLGARADSDSERG
jgi:hypothetical protein